MVSRVAAFLLSLAMVLAGMPLAAFAGAAPVAAIMSGCPDCCDSSTDAGCASALPEDEGVGQSGAKPNGAWACGIVPASYIQPGPPTTLAVEPVPVHFGPPPYVSFGRFLL